MRSPTEAARLMAVWASAADGSPDPGGVRRAAGLSAVRRFHVLSEYILRDALFVHDHRGRVVLTNSRASEYLGYTREELLALNVTAHLEDSDLARAQAAWGRLNIGSCTPVLDRYRRKDGSLLEVEVTYAVLESGAERLYLVTLHDAAASARAAEALEVAATIIQSIDEGVLVMDAEGIIEEANDAALRISGCGRDEIVGRAFPSLHAESDGTGVYQTAWEAVLRLGSWDGECANRRKDGEVYRESVLICAVPGRSPESRKYVALLMDSTHLRQIEKLAYHDPLSGLPNRLLFADRLEQAVKQSERRGRFIAVAYIDIDNFKRINDDFGHKAGDDLLVTLGERMRLSLRDGDTLARIGGDEFAALLVDLKHPEDYEIALSRLLEAAAQPLTIGGHTVSVSASIGLALHPDHGASPSQLMQNADAAMYQAKHDGKGRYCLAGRAADLPGLAAAGT